LRLKLRRRIRHPTGGSKQSSLESPVPHSDRRTGAETSNPERAGPRPVAAKSVRSGVRPAGRERSELPATASTTAKARRLDLATGQRRPMGSAYSDR
jgi:hypothetical protein